MISPFKKPKEPEIQEPPKDSDSFFPTIVLNDEQYRDIIKLLETPYPPEEIEQLRHLYKDIHDVKMSNE